VAVALVLIGFTAVACLWAYLVLATDPQPMASVGGCASTVFPLPRGSSLNDRAELSTGWPLRTVGCWAWYSEDGSPDKTFRYYANASNRPGWTLMYAYPQTGAARFSNSKDPNLRADVSVEGRRLDVTVCFCDPGIFSG
jgi:hypothetical protein